MTHYINHITFLWTIIMIQTLPELIQADTNSSVSATAGTARSSQPVFDEHTSSDTANSRLKGEFEQHEFVSGVVTKRPVGTTKVILPGSPLQRQKGETGNDERPGLKMDSVSSDPNRGSGYPSTQDQHGEKLNGYDHKAVAAGISPSYVYARAPSNSRATKGSRYGTVVKGADLPNCSPNEECVVYLKGYPRHGIVYAESPTRIGLVERR